MKFIGRSKELEYIKEARKLSESKLFTLSIYGPRRVGKTRLILESLGKGDLYFFVNKEKSSDGLMKEYEAALRSAGVLTGMESLRDWDDFFKVIFERFTGIVAFDEFQNFTRVEKSVLGILQKHIDLNESRRGLLLIFSGSTTGLVKKMFSDSKEPLYGRLKRSLNLKPLPFADVIAMCAEAGIHDIESAISLYSVFGGFPKYYVSIEDEGMQGRTFGEIMERFFLQENAMLEEEANSIISMEFGKRSGTYYDILAAVASGSTRISEIASFMRKKETAITRQVNELVNYFGFLSVENQVVGGKRQLYISHPLMDLWFRFFFQDISAYKRREEWMLRDVRNGLNYYLSRRFEYVCREFLEAGKTVAFSNIGRQWGKIPGAPKGENQYEIDIVAANEETGDILFVECKWEGNVSPEKVLKELKEKAGYVDWHRGKRKERYAIFAKSFRDRKAPGGVLLFDLKDMEMVLNHEEAGKH